MYSSGQTKEYGKYRTSEGEKHIKKGDMQFEEEGMYCILCGRKLAKNKMCKVCNEEDLELLYKPNNLLIECPHCQKKVTPQGNYCRYCGENLKVPEPKYKGANLDKIICPHCGKKISRVGSFCPLCGDPIK